MGPVARLALHSPLQVNAAPAPADVPRSYAQWSVWLDRLSEGLQDEACLDAMCAGELNASGGVVTLFSQRLAEEFNARLMRCSEHLTRDLSIGNDESQVVRAILNARKHLAFLHRLAHIESFPATLRTHLTDELRKFAQRAQQSLEDSARTDRSGRLLVLLRNNPLVRYEPAAQDGGAASTARAMGMGAAVGAAAQHPLSQTGARRRNIIL